MLAEQTDFRHWLDEVCLDANDLKLVGCDPRAAFQVDPKHLLSDFVTVHAVWQILALVKVALSRLADQSVITVRVNPKDCQSILHFRESPGHRDSWHDGIKLVEDPLITRGGCLIETDSGVIDARVEEQFREIEKGFFD